LTHEFSGRPSERTSRFAINWSDVAPGWPAGKDELVNDPVRGAR
jgi:hypothetical protein